jgi:hypothetical protein
VKNCLLKHIIDGYIEAETEMMGRQRRGHKQLQDDFKETRGYWKLRDHTLWRTRFG